MRANSVAGLINRGAALGKSRGRGSGVEKWEKACLWCWCTLTLGVTYGNANCFLMSFFHQLDETNIG